MTNDSTRFTLSTLWRLDWPLDELYRDQCKWNISFPRNISSSTTLNPTNLPEGNLWLNVTTGDSFGKARLQNWIYLVDSSNSHQVNVTVSGTHLTTPSLILGPTGRLVPGNPSDDSNGSGPSHASCSWDGANWFNAQASATYGISVKLHIWM